VVSGSVTGAQLENLIIVLSTPAWDGLMLARFAFVWRHSLIDRFWLAVPEVHETGARFGVAGVCCEFIPFKTLMDWDLV